MIIYPGRRFSYNSLAGFEEVAFGRSENGWMDSEVFIGRFKKCIYTCCEYTDG